MDIERPVKVQIKPYGSGEIGVFLYDANGSTCGEVTVHTNGSIFARLLGADNKTTAYDYYKKKAKEILW